MTKPPEKSAKSAKSALTYEDAGVSIDRGDALVERIKPLAKSTTRPGSRPALGGFGGVFDLSAAGYDDPVLVSGTDGVGTKLRIAIDSGKLDTVGIDLVAMCANDVLAQGAEPLFFLDYYAAGRLDTNRAAEVISGIAEGCRRAGCALIGGETAEMPGMYEGEDFDLAGFVVGAAECGQVLPYLDLMEKGDILIGLASSGPHANGYSLIRKVVEISGLSWDDPAPFAPDQPLCEALLTPTRIYVASLLPQIKQGHIKGLAHITGGGITENVPRMLPKSLKPRYDWDAIARPDVFSWLKEAGNIEEAEMRRAFNCGIGMALCVSPDYVMTVLEALSEAGEQAMVIGELASA